MVQTINLIINLDHDEWILDDHSKTLVEIGARELPLPLFLLDTKPVHASLRTDTA